jgi:hypothetical protein
LRKKSSHASYPGAVPIWGITYEFHSLPPPIVNAKDPETRENELKKGGKSGAWKGSSTGEANATGKLQHILLRSIANVKTLDHI